MVDKAWRNDLAHPSIWTSCKLGCGISSGVHLNLERLDALPPSCFNHLATAEKVELLFPWPRGSREDPQILLPESLAAVRFPHLVRLRLKSDPDVVGHHHPDYSDNHDGDAMDDDRGRDLLLSSAFYNGALMAPFYLAQELEVQEVNTITQLGVRLDHLIGLFRKLHSFSGLVIMREDQLNLSMASLSWD